MPRLSAPWCGRRVGGQYVSNAERSTISSDEPRLRPVSCDTSTRRRLRVANDGSPPGPVSSARHGRGERERAAPSTVRATAPSSCLPERQLAVPQRRRGSRGRLAGDQWGVDRGRGTTSIERRGEGRDPTPGPGAAVISETAPAARHETLASVGVNLGCRASTPRPKCSLGRRVPGTG